MKTNVEGESSQPRRLVNPNSPRSILSPIPKDHSARGGIKSLAIDWLFIVRIERWPRIKAGGGCSCERASERASRPTDDLCPQTYLAALFTGQEAVCPEHSPPFLRYNCRFCASTQPGRSFFAADLSVPPSHKKLTRPRSWLPLAHPVRLHLGPPRHRVLLLSLSLYISSCLFLPALYRDILLLQLTSSVHGSLSFYGSSTRGRVHPIFSTFLFSPLALSLSLSLSFSLSFSKEIFLPLSLGRFDRPNLLR